MKRPLPKLHGEEGVHPDNDDGDLMRNPDMHKLRLASIV